MAKSRLFRLKAKDIIALLGIIIIVLILILNDAFNKKNKENLNISAKFSICYITGLFRTSCAKFIEYKYFVGNKEFKDRENFRNGINIKGGRYYIAFSPDNPEINEVKWDMPIPKNITEALLGGWDYSPELIPPSQK